MATSTKHSKDQTPQLISYMTLRRLIGYLGIFLPAVLLVGTLIFGHCHQIQDSVSEYYYTVMSDIFVGILCAYSIFLITYKGYDTLDNIASNLAGIFALGIAFFPTPLKNDSCAGMRSLDYTPISSLHFTSATLFFLTLSYISYFLFTKTSGKMSKQKVKRNRVYKICAVIMVISMVVILLFKTIDDINHSLKEYHPVFWMEWVALSAFGVSWLVKGELLLSDN
ncbi:MAG: DUF998 domain-containing protein [Ignavibacteriae bacterium]|nr:DUF998 domain-containing protein [Ignavibacteriota bacterium]